MKAYSNFMRYTQIMVFYVLISYILFPLIGYVMFGKTLQSAGHGFVVGSLISVALWYTYGRTLVND
jgi:hypothetical protein